MNNDSKHVYNAFLIFMTERNKEFAVADIAACTGMASSTAYGVVAVLKASGRIREIKDAPGRCVLYKYSESKASVVKCDICGYNYPKHFGRCPGCEARDNEMSARNEQRTVEENRITSEIKSINAAIERLIKEGRSEEAERLKIREESARETLRKLKADAL